MKLLLDTHTFIWWDSDPAQLSPAVLALCQDRTNRLLLSVVSVWEMVIKVQLGKLQLKLPLTEIIESQRQANEIEIVPVNLVHVLTVERLQVHHKDPFDRLLIAQANVEDATLLSRDPGFKNYSVKLFW